METGNREQITSQLARNSMLRSTFAQYFGVSRSQPEIYYDDLIEVLDDAYVGLTIGIHDDVHAWHTEQNLSYESMDASEALTESEVFRDINRFKISPREDEQPEYLKNYIEIRNNVYDELLSQAICSNDYGILISTIVELKESTLAKHLLSEYITNKMPMPSAIAGNVERVHRFISYHNGRIKDMHSSVRNFSLTEARRKQKFEMRRELNASETGFIGSIAIGMKFKMGYGISYSKSEEKYFFGPLTRIAKLPTVPQQLISQEEEMYSTY